MRSEPQVQPHAELFSSQITGLAAALILACTFVLSLLWSYSKHFWVDELLEYLSDSKPSFAAVLAGQRYAPFSLEPPLFHLLEHASLLLFPGHPEFGCRLLSMLSLLVTEVCVFSIVVRLGRGRAAALLAMSLPLLFVTGYYAAEARVYSFFAAVFAVALLSWQSSIDPKARSRRLALSGLFLSLTLAVLSHYYGIFLPFALLAGELARSRGRRRLDGPVLLAILLPLAFFALNHPFMAPLPEMQAHYYNTGETRWSALPLSYLWLLIGFFISNPHLVGTRILVLSLLLCVALLLLFLRLFVLPLRTRWQPVQQAMIVALLAAVCLPILNFLVARFITHAYVERYNLPAVPALSVLLGCALPGRISRKQTIAAISAILVISSALTLRAAQHQRDATAEHALALSDVADIRHSLAGIADQHIYMQDAGYFLVTWFYAPPELRRQLVCVYSADRELYWLGRTPASIFVRNIGRTTQVPVLRFDELEKDPAPHLFVIYHLPLAAIAQGNRTGAVDLPQDPGGIPMEEWLQQEVAFGAIHAVSAGKGLGGHLELLSFPPAHGEREIRSPTHQPTQ